MHQIHNANGYSTSCALFPSVRVKYGLVSQCNRPLALPSARPSTTATPPATPPAAPLPAARPRTIWRVEGNMRIVRTHLNPFLPFVESFNNGRAAVA